MAFITKTDIVSILLATYNSEKYISQLIDSILTQSYSNWLLYVRDDCSTDNTYNLLQQYSEANQGKIILVDNNGLSLGAYRNFIYLLESVQSDYYMFCDHDDIWLPSKIEDSFFAIKKAEKDFGHLSPIIVHSDMIVVDEFLNEVHPSFWKYSRLLPDNVSFLELSVCHSVNGCTMLFNDSAKIVSLKNVDYCSMHDMLLARSVAEQGGIISPIKHATVLYRQHGQNVIGATRFDLKYVFKRIIYSWGSIKDNYINWKNLHHMRKVSLLSYLFCKIKISFLRITMKQA